MSGVDTDQVLAQLGKGMAWACLKIGSGCEQRHGWRPAEFVMIGNSLRSDILPVLEIGAYAIHIPAEITWQHEQVAEDEVAEKHFMRLDKISQVLEHFETPIRHS